jgi:hypothetical protein
MNEHGVMDCGGFSDVAAELALGVLTGRERADALAHLETCDSCREMVRQLAIAGEELVELIPAVEPSAGFETRVMARIGIDTGRVHRTHRRVGRRSRPRWLTSPWRSASASGLGRPRRLLAAGAAALAVFAAGLGGWGLGAATTSPATAASPLHTTAMVSETATHQTVGEVFFYTKGEPWMYMSVDLPSGNEVVTCQLEGPGGYRTVGSFRLLNGYGAWGSPALWDTGQVTGARIVGADGKVLATARFS